MGRCLAADSAGTCRQPVLFSLAIHICSTQSQWQQSEETNLQETDSITQESLYAARVNCAIARKEISEALASALPEGSFHTRV